MNKVYILEEYGAKDVFDIIPPATAESLAAEVGVTDPAFYQEFPESDFEAACYNFVNGFSLSGGVVSFSLDAAKESAYKTEKDRANLAVQEEYAAANLTSDLLIGPASQDPASRPTRYQATFDSIAVISDQLNATLDQIDACTDINELNDIVNPPTGIINIGRGQFGGPLDLNASNYVVFNSASMLESETELFAPATSSVVPYQEFPPDDFNSGGPIFSLDNFLIQIRETTTSRVIAEFEVPLSTDGSNVDISF